MGALCSIPQHDHKIAITVDVPDRSVCVKREIGTQTDITMLPLERVKEPFPIEKFQHVHC
jgi:hypothetical protein